MSPKMTNNRFRYTDFIKVLLGVSQGEVLMTVNLMTVWFYLPWDQHLAFPSGSGLSHTLNGPDLENEKRPTAQIVRVPVPTP